jgi:hypothetical protein
MEDMAAANILPNLAGNICHLVRDLAQAQQ